MHLHMKRVNKNKRVWTKEKQLKIKDTFAILPCQWGKQEHEICLIRTETEKCRLSFNGSNIQRVIAASDGETYIRKNQFKRQLQNFSSESN